MKEYKFEGWEDFKGIIGNVINKEDYKTAHKNLVIPCHDAFIEYKGGILLVRRLREPAKGLLWPLGGRIQRGISAEDSLKDRVKKESGLDIEGIKEIGHARVFFRTEPFGHGRGTDTINFVYFCRGFGDLRLDEYHTDPTIVSREDYKKIRNVLHPYVRDFMDLVMDIVKKRYHV